MTTSTTTPTTDDSLNPALKFAVENNNPKLLRWVFAQGMPTNIDECVKLAIKTGIKENVDYLTEKLSPPPTVSSASTYRPLVVKKDRIQMSRFTQSEKNSQLMIALHYNPQEFKKDLESGKVSVEEINYRNEEGWSVLHYLARNTSKIADAAAMMQKLLDLGANVNSLDVCGSTPLMMTCSQEDSTLEAAKILLKHPKIEINAVNQGNTTALFAASQMGHQALVELLLNDPRIDVNHRDHDGETALMMASSCTHGSGTIIKMFLKHPKIDPTLADKVGETPLVRLSRNKVLPKVEFDEIVEILFQNPFMIQQFDVMTPAVIKNMCALLSQFRN